MDDFELRWSASSWSGDLAALVSAAERGHHEFGVWMTFVDAESIYGGGGWRDTTEAIHDLRGEDHWTSVNIRILNNDTKRFLTVYGEKDAHVVVVAHAPVDESARRSHGRVVDWIERHLASAKRTSRQTGSDAALEFEGLSPTEFEEFCFHLLDGHSRFRNVDWRKGTPKLASPSDSGRDIEAEVDVVDVDDSRHVERWFIDCKHYDAGVPPEALKGLLTWADAERPHVALFICSGYLSNGSKTFLKNWEAHNRPAFRIKYWERPVLAKLVGGNRELLDRFLLGRVRSQSEILTAETAFFDRVWYERHLAAVARHESGEVPMAPEVYEQAVSAAERARAERDDLRSPVSDFECGTWSGKLSALRWVLGGDWDLLDT
jgi:hypothetical protein